MKKIYVIISLGQMLGMQSQGYEKICDTLEEAQAWVDDRVSGQIRGMLSDDTPYKYKGGPIYHILETISIHHHSIGKNNQWPMSNSFRNSLIQSIAKEEHMHPGDVWKTICGQPAFKHFRVPAPY